ncbi:MAG TPA: sugar ABC transporter permease, partial [Clostridia bacterium]|nr:sugar ABC transporter permease [Clostridia bacterium]
MQLRQTKTAPRVPIWTRLYRDIVSNPAVYVMLIPVLAFYLLFCYKPMYGIIIAFKDYSPRRGILGSQWVGLKYFTQFFTGPYFGRTLKNT